MHTMYHTWTTVQHDGPNHLGLCARVVHEAHMDHRPTWMALITSNCGYTQRPDSVFFAGKVLGLAGDADVLRELRPGAPVCFRPHRCTLVIMHVCTLDMLPRTLPQLLLSLPFRAAPGLCSLHNVMYTASSVSVSLFRLNFSGNLWATETDSKFLYAYPCQC